jgi:hypothetical protein
MQKKAGNGVCSVLILKSNYCLFLHFLCDIPHDQDHLASDMFINMFMSVPVSVKRHAILKVSSNFGPVKFLENLELILGTGIFAAFLLR